LEKKTIGRIRKVPLRTLWKKEDRDFTCWLEENIDYLNDLLESNLTVLSREEPVGPFKLDLFAEDVMGNKVIIENQLEKTDHDHLGKIITYLSNLQAQTAIWITSNPTNEHRKAIEWLNEFSPNDFYLIKVETIKIEPEVTPAPLFTIIEAPSQESKQLGEEKKKTAERYTIRKEFWTQLLEKAKNKTRLHSSISPSMYSWIGTGAGKSGIGYNYVITSKYGRVEIYLDRGKDFEEPNVNKQRFDRLFENKEEIEKAFGDKLVWERLDHRRASRISYTYVGVGYRDTNQWDSLQEKMIDAMIRLERAFKKYIKKLD
jgi:hypothetical protein